MKRVFAAMLILAPLIFSSFSCGGDRSPAMVPTQRVSEDIEDQIDSKGILTDKVTLEDPDGHFGIDLSAGTTALDNEGNPLSELTLEPPGDLPSPPPARKNIAAADFGPDGATFDKPAEITMSYDPDALPQGASPDDLAMAYYDEEQEEWVDLIDIVIDTNNHTVTGKVTHLTLFAIQLRERNTEQELPSEDEPTEGSATSAEFRQILDLPALNYHFPQIIGQNVWAIGYYGDTSFALDGAAFLVEDYHMLLTDEAIPQKSMARLDGNLPSANMDGTPILVYGVVKDFGQTYPDAYTPWPEPLITVESYEVLDVPTDGGELIDYLTWVNYEGNRVGLDDNVQLVSFTRDTDTWVFESVLPDEVNGEGGTRAGNCDRALIISGGIRASGNHPRYARNIKAMYEKCVELGLNDAQIDVVYYNGKPSGIEVGGEDIVDINATEENIRAIIERYRREMDPSCTLLLFVTDHGTGYDGGKWDGERPASLNSTEAGQGNKTYAENAFAVDGNGWLWDTNVFSGVGKTWKYAKHRFTGVVKFYVRQGDTWVEAGSDANGNGYLSEHEIGADLNGDGDSVDNTGWVVANIVPGLSHSNGEWDTDRDTAEIKDIRYHWDGNKLVFQRLQDGTWQTMGEDTNGDGKIDAADGGIDWNLDGNKNGQVGFHEGINLLGHKVLWDDAFAEMLRPLKDMRVHINALMVQCFSGGFVSNLTGIVEFIGTGSSEDTVHWSTNVDGQKVAADGIAFLSNLRGLDVESWGTAWIEGIKADQQAWKRDTAGMSAAKATASKNYQQTGGTPKLETETTYEKHDDGMYSISLRLPQGDQVYDFEIILGLQKPRWNISMGEGIGFPEGLPEGMDTELIPGGIRVYSSSPFGVSPLMVRMRAPEGTEITRIDLTDADHTTIGYTTPKTEDIPETNPMEASLSVSVVREYYDEITCECTGGEVMIETRSQKTNTASEDVGAISMVEIYIDGKLSKSEQFSGKTQTNWIDFFSKELSAGSHIARLVVRNWYGQEIIREVEFYVCQEQLTMIPVSETDKVQMTAEVKACSIVGFEPDCTAEITVDWGAQAVESGFGMKAAWFRIDGMVVDSSKLPEFTPPASFPFGLSSPASPEPETGNTSTSLGGRCTNPVQPGSTVQLEVVVLGSDCKYYTAAWGEQIPSCPPVYIPPPPPPPCFSADTLVLMANSSTKQISEIQVGDIVKSYDVNSGQVVDKAVVSIKNGQSDHYYIINGNLRVTPPHPFYTVDRGWVPVEGLQVGDQIRSIYGTTTIASVEYVLEGQATYNIGVEESGNFFVSANGDDFYLVHQGS